MVHPGGQIELAGRDAYTQGFQARREGYGSAIGVVVFLVILVATLLWWRVQRRAEEEQ